MPPKGTAPITPRSHGPFIGVAVIAVIAAAALIVLAMNNPTASRPAEPVVTAPPAPAPAAPAAQPTTSAVPARPPEPSPAPPPAATPPAIAKKPAKGPLPPLPMLGFAPPRPMDVVQDAFEFAARRPDVLEYVPCFCGCENSGHVGNDDCFVKSRDASGNVEWEPHGMS